MSSVISAENVVYQHPGESGAVQGMDFTNLMLTGEEIQSVDSAVADSADLTVAIADPAVSGNLVRLTISDGNHGDDYEVTVTVTTSLGRTVVGVGKLFVRNC